MIPLPDDIARKDVEQWLAGGYFYGFHEGSWEVCSLGGYDSSSDKFRVCWLDPDFRDGFLRTSEMAAHWPVCGALNLVPTPGDHPPHLMKFAVVLTRLQKKQWKRTYNSSCLRIRVLSNVAAHFKMSSEHRAVVQAAFSPQYFTYDQACTMMKSGGWASVALSPSIVLLQNPKQKVVFLDSEVVGIIDDETNVFTCVNQSLKRKILPTLGYSVG